MSARRLFAAQWHLAVATVEAVVAGGRSADRLLQSAFREQRKMGARDRALVTDLVYGVLRDLRRLQCIAGAAATAQQWCALRALDAGIADAARLAALGVADADVLARRLQCFDASRLTVAQRFNVPDAIHARWCTELGEPETARLAQALMAQAPVDLRVNTLKATRDAAQSVLSAAGLDARPTPYAPAGLRLQRRVALQPLSAFRDGWIEPQDEGSQLLALLVAAQPGERIADWCAGAGGKTLALAAQMQDRGELFAMDADARRLQRLLPRMQRAGAHCVRVLDPGAAPPGALDAVLVDAPCSGSGTWRRQPEARLKALDLAALSELQTQILQRAADHVRPGGRLVYATCSLLHAENQGVVARFLAMREDFALDDAGRILATQGVELPGRWLELYPHRHGTDGFFAAAMRRADTSSACTRPSAR
ncbi:MAG: RsmB/NOP family class I SAM-dependent RNA methyltransferase [Pseudomonadota bacterium]